MHIERLGEFMADVTSVEQNVSRLGAAIILAGSSSG